MKIYFSILLCIALALPVIADGTNDPPPIEASVTLCEAAFVVTIAVLATSVIIYVAKATSNCVRHKRLVLQSNCGNGWENIATNDVCLTTNKLAVFVGQMIDECCIYRVQVLPLPNP
jgi:hypothetical protein